MRKTNGSGSISPHGPGRWRLRVTVGVNETGVIDRRSRIVSGTKASAERELRQWLAALEGERPGSRAMTLAELVDRHADDMGSRGLAPKTVERARTMPTQWIPATVMAMPAVEISHRHLEAAFTVMLTGTPTKPAVSAGTVLALHATMSGAFRWAQRAGVVQVNVAQLARRPKSSGARHDPPTVAQLALLVQAADSVSAAAGMLVRLAAATGARRGEISALRWSDLDPVKQTLSISRSITEKTLLEGPTKTRARRVISLDVGTLAMLRDWRTDQHALAELCGGAIDGTGFILAAQDHDVAGQRAWSPDRMSKAWERTRKLVDGCGHLRLHDLRHAHATMLLEAGTPLLVVAGRLGHSTVATTAKTYAHFVERTDRDAADLIGRIIHGRETSPAEAGEVIQLRAT